MMEDSFCDSKWEEQLHGQDDGRCKSMTQDDQQIDEGLQCTMQQIQGQ